MESSTTRAIQLCENVHPHKLWNCYVTPEFSGVPKRGDKMRRGYHTLAFSGGQNWAELLRNPCVLGGPQQNQELATSPRLLGGPQVGGIATSPLHSRGSLEEGTKSEVATSPPPSRGPTGGRNCKINPAFSGVPKGINSEVATSPLSSRGVRIGRKCNITPAFSGVPRRGDKIRSGYITRAFSGFPIVA